MANIVPTFLANLNPHEKDQYISFQEEGHKYTIHGEGGYTSITTLIAKLFEHFDANKIVDKMMTGKNILNPSNKYYGMSKQNILDLWDANGKEASEKGTQMHYLIEQYYNNINADDGSIEYEYFKKYLLDFPDLKPYRTEWTVFYSKYKLCGSIDMIYENPDGTLQISDWKRVKSIEYEAFNDKRGIIPCLAHMQDTNFWHYCLQLNLYKTILEKQYDKKVTALYLICLHPDNANKSYERLAVPILDEDVTNILDWWISLV
jgi:ATP-dependent exoDNAse (exonuclease V) beta subunit